MPLVKNETAQKFAAGSARKPIASVPCFCAGKVGRHVHTSHRAAGKAITVDLLPLPAP